MTNPWKWTALGLLTMAGVVATSTLTTVFLLRPSATVTIAAADAPPTIERRAPNVRVAPAALSRAAAVSNSRLTRVAADGAPALAVSRPQSVAPQSTLATVEPVREPAAVARSTAPSAAPTPVASTPAPPTSVAGERAASTIARPSAVPVAVSATADCETGGDRALRIAKPGVLGAVLGAGLGAAGGAIASGGKGAGQGALIGGIAGAALGTGYGAYKTKHECGTIFGARGAAGAAGAPAATDSAVAARPAPREDVMAPLQATPSEGRIQVYGVR